MKTDDEALRDVPANGVGPGPGRPPHEPTEKSRAKAKALAAYGTPHEQIARALDIHRETLTKYYRDELDLGVIEANAKVAETLFNQGVRDGNTAALIWWTKSRMGWKEKHDLEHSGPGGGPVAMTWLPPASE